MKGAPLSAQPPYGGAPPTTGSYGQGYPGAPHAGLASLKAPPAGKTRGGGLGIGPPRAGTLVTLLILVVIALVIVQLVRPVGHPTAVATLTGNEVSVPGAALSIPWPRNGEAAMAVEGVGWVGQTTNQQPQPIASLTKMMTAYVILKSHPIPYGQSGPTITVTPADVALYQQEKAAGYSVVAVAAGETLTERQALEALLVPSGDNIAVLLADWDAGSKAAFVAKMNAAAAALGMHHTHYADPSGVDPATVSTAVDQTKLAMMDMQIPTFRHINAMGQVTLPVAGTVYNYDHVLGQDGIVGIKTGWTSQALGCFAFAAKHTVDGHPVTIVGTVLGQPAVGASLHALRHALDVGERLEMAMAKQMSEVSPLATGQQVAIMNAPWKKGIPIVAGSVPTVLGWADMKLPAKVVLHAPTGSAPASTKVGDLEITYGTSHLSVPLKLGAPLPSPSILWRLTRT